MELRPDDTQQQLIDAFAALYAKESPPERVRSAEPLGFDERLWAQLTEMGVVAMAVDEAHGGWGASTLDLGLVAEQHGRALGSAPLIETQVAARLLARLGETTVTELAAALGGERMTTISFTPTRDGRALMVPAGAVADSVLVRSGTSLVLAELGDDRVLPHNLGSMPVADVDVSDGRVVAEGPVADAAFEAALDDWLVLTANALAGMASRSVEIGVEYVNEREAFGQKIGAFQAIAHRLADSAAASDGAQLLARQAAWAAREDPDRFRELAAMAFAFACETAADASYRALHFHGGYGFMLEYDIQLYYRRVRAWPAVVMSASQAYRRVADARYDAPDHDDRAR
jgi:alkylation response protein AidB-like acyl-CoA dehydrogenase